MRSVTAALAVLLATGLTGAGDDDAAARRTSFAIDLYKTLAADDPDNLVVSPASVQIALGMTYPGAGGSTAAEMEKVLHLEPGDDSPISGYVTRLKKLGRAKGGPTLSVANRIWVAKDAEVRKTFLSKVKKRYGAPAGRADFEDDPEGTRTDINEWVATQTKDKIPKLLPEKIFEDPSTKILMVLVNAIYFAGKWSSAFDEAETRDGTFTRADGTKVTARMMSKTGGALYGAAAGATVLEMSYRKSTLAMMFVLPDADLATLEGALSVETVDEWAGALHDSPDVVIQIPKFEIRQNSNLGAALSAMGMPTAFVENVADFSGMLTDAALAKGKFAWISAVIHEAYVKVDESGTEAAAATAVIMAEGDSVSETPTFIADRPFLFLLRDTKTGDILFIGRVADPTDK